MSGTMFRGTNVEQDCRWGRTEKKLLKTMEKNGTFAAILETKVDLKKVNIDIMSKWVTERIVQLFGFEDEIVINLIINMLNSPKVLDPKRMQIDITGFLEKKAPEFMEELWTLLCDAQEQPSGIPSVFLEKKKEEILKRQKRTLDSQDNQSEPRSRSTPDRFESRVREEVESKADTLEVSHQEPRKSPIAESNERHRRSRSRDRDRDHNPRSRERNPNRDRSRERYADAETRSGRERRVDDRDQSRNKSRNYSERRVRSRSRDRTSHSDDRDRRRSSRRSPSSSSSSSESSNSTSSSSRRSRSAERRSRR